MIGNTAEIPEDAAAVREKLQEEVTKKREAWKTTLTPHQVDILTRLELITNEMAQLNLPHVFWVDVEGKGNILRYNHWWSRNHSDLLSTEAWNDSMRFIWMVACQVAGMLHGMGFRMQIESKHHDPRTTVLDTDKCAPPIN